METAKVDVRKLQLLNDRITQVIEALNQVRFSVHGLQQTPAFGPQPSGPWAWGQMAPWAQQPWPQQWAQPQWSGGPQQWSGGPQQWNPANPGPTPQPGPVGGLSHTAAEETWSNAWPQQRWPQQPAWSWPNQWAWGQSQQWAQPAPWAQPTPWANPGL